MPVRPARTGDRDEIIRMRTAFWPDSTSAEVDALLGRPGSDSMILVAERESGGLGGFAEVGSRPFAEGCRTSPVAYLEGIWVDPDLHRLRVATRLLEAAEAWAHSNGFTEFASDTRIGNRASEALLLSTGFREAERIICFVKDVAPPAE